MKCIYCGKEGEARLCLEHRTTDILEELLAQVGRYSSEHCDNPHIAAYVESFEGYGTAYKTDFAEVFDLFSPEKVTYPYCYYLGDTYAESFPETAEDYLSSHDWREDRSQAIINLLLRMYNRKDFNAPQPYVEFICKTGGLIFELYMCAANYLGMTGDYDDAAALLGKISKELEAGALPSRVGRGADGQLADVKRAGEQNEKWRLRPYWPKSPEAQRQLAEQYGPKGIRCGKMSSGRESAWPTKVSPKDFAGFVEVEVPEGDFCAMWLRSVPGRVKGVCEIVASKIEHGDEADRFEQIVRPWKVSLRAKGLAASCLGMTVEELDGKPDVFEVAPAILSFVDGLPLVVADSDQLSLLERCLRYSGLASIESGVCILDASSSGVAASALEGISGEHVGETGYVFSSMRELTAPEFDSFVAFDTETTGFGPSDQITEIGAVRVEGGIVVDRFQMLANPGKPIPSEVQTLTGITDAMVTDAMPYTEVAVLFSQFVGKSILVGHNVAFDLRMLARAALPAGVDFANDYFDTNTYAKGLKAEHGWEKTKLGYLAEQLGVELSNAHRALADAEATAGVYLKLRGEL